MPRLFTGISVRLQDLGPQATSLFATVEAAGMRCTGAHNLHVTLQFLGSVAEEHIAALVSALNNVSGPPPFEMELRGCGWFPDTGEPKTIWIGADGGPALLQLVLSIEKRLSEVGMPRESKPYRPHVTIGRARRNQRIDRGALAALSHLDFLGRCQATEFHLYESLQEGDRRVYRPRATFRLQTPYTEFL